MVAESYGAGSRRPSRRQSNCQRCGNDLEVVKNPVSRLRWTRYWLKGVKSLFTRPLLACVKCGAVYTWEGELLAVGAVETSSELKLRALREDMSNLRDAFGTIVIAGGITAGWIVLGPGSFDVGAAVIAGSVSGVAFLPFSYFARRARQARRELKKLKETRIKGELTQ